MKSLLKISVLLCTFFITSNLISQQLTLNDLVSMNNDKASDSKKHLPSSKKWVQELSKVDRADSAVLVFKMEFNKSDKAKHWVSVYSEEDKPKSVSYQTTKKMYVDKIVEDIKAAGYTLSNSKVTDFQTTLYYTKDSVTIEVTTFSSETNPGTVYLVTLNS